MPRRPQAGEQCVQRNRHPTRRAADGSVAAIVVGAGQGRRMGGMDKAFLPLLGRRRCWPMPWMHWRPAPQVSEIALVVSAALVERCRQVVQAAGVAESLGHLRGRRGARGLGAGGTGRRQTHRVGAYPRRRAALADTGVGGLGAGRRCRHSRGHRGGPPPRYDQACPSGPYGGTHG